MLKLVGERRRPGFDPVFGIIPMTFRGDGNFRQLFGLLHSCADYSYHLATLANGNNILAHSGAEANKR